MELVVDTNVLLAALLIALGLALDIPIWSNDKGMRLQDEVKVCSTKELIVILGRQRE